MFVCFFISSIFYEERNKVWLKNIRYFLTLVSLFTFYLWKKKSCIFHCEKLFLCSQNIYVTTWDKFVLLSFWCMLFLNIRKEKSEQAFETHNKRPTLLYNINILSINKKKIEWTPLNFPNWCISPESFKKGGGIL